LDSVAGAIARISQLSGESVDVISSKLIPSLDGTASSAKRLNEQYHFLNIEQYNLNDYY
jgi:phage-related minor tail protein